MPVNHLSKRAELFQWFGRTTGRSDAELILFCLPYSGGGASIFRNWPRALPSAVDVAAVRLPGREGRIAEPHSLSPNAIARAIAARADRPYAIYGHSLGARLGFEVIRELRRIETAQPVLFYAAACGPPDSRDPLARSVELPDDEFLSALIGRVSAPAELRDEPDLRELLLPVLRGDFEWINRYEYQPEPALDVPLVALAGAADPASGPLSMLRWSRHTTAAFRLHTLAGGHFFLRTAADHLISLLTEDLDLANIAAPGRPRRPPSRGEAHIWLARLDELPGFCTALSELSPDEVRRAALLHDAQDRRRYIGGCVAARRILRVYGVSASVSAPPEQADSLPEACDPAGLRMDLSQSGGLLLAGITTDGAIGVDLELFQAGSPTAGLRARTEARAVRKAAHSDRGAAGSTAWQVTHLPLESADGAVALAGSVVHRFEIVTEATL
jgi:surfactin synthase thioesterase subunit